ncbi:MAG: cation:proton antiporter subunit C [Synergistaceae bacterium]|nr:cation:proton antiporter subunit C [Synergistaceae bacterium]
MTGNMIYTVIALLMLISLVALVTQKNLIKICISISILGAAVNFYLVALGYRSGGSVPIHYLAGDNKVMVLPTPQCLTLTAIVIALATTALMYSLIVLIYKHYGTVEIDEIRRLRG